MWGFQQAFLEGSFGNHMSYSLNSWGYMRDYVGAYMGGYEGDTRSLEGFKKMEGPFLRQSLVQGLWWCLGAQ